MTSALAKNRHRNHNDPSTEQADILIKAFFTSADPSLTSLDLSNSSITALPRSLFQYADRYPSRSAALTLLNLAHNPIASLPESLSILPNLRILFFLSNKFQVIPNSLASNSSITMLSFRSNILENTLQAQNLPPNLNWLILTSNRLTALPAAFSPRCNKVRKLMLSNNNLESLPHSFYSEMTHLELLRLCNNNFETFPTKLFTLPNLTWLSLSGNPCTRQATSVVHLPIENYLFALEPTYTVDWKAPIASGTSGTAFPGHHNKTGELVAVKRFLAQSGSDGTTLDELQVTFCVSGVENVVQAEAYSIQPERESATISLVTKLVPGNAKALAGPPSFASCTRSVYRGGLSFRKEEATQIVEGVERAVHGLLRRNVAHGDVYGHNILVGEPGADGVRPVVLADLGAAWFVPEEAREGTRKIELRALDVFREEVFGLVCEP